MTDCNCKTKPASSKPFDPSKPVQLRDGRKAVILGEMPNHFTSYGRVLVGYGDAPTSLLKPGCSVLYMWDPETGKITGSRYDYLTDLVNVVERTSKWSNVYRGYYLGDREYSDRDSAIRNSLKGCLGQLEWVIEDGVTVDIVFHKKGVCPCA